MKYKIGDYVILKDDLTFEKTQISSFIIDRMRGGIYQIDNLVYDRYYIIQHWVFKEDNIQKQVNPEINPEYFL
jgi:hypothetical protein